DLYTYLIKHSIQIIEEMYEQIDLSETDLFKRIEKIGIQKLHIQQRFRRVFDFLVSTINEETDEVKEIIKQKVDPIYEKGLEKMKDCIDYSKFLKYIDI